MCRKLIRCQAIVWTNAWILLIKPLARNFSNRLLMTSQWPDNRDASTWKVISNSLNIDFYSRGYSQPVSNNLPLDSTAIYFTIRCAGSMHQSHGFPLIPASTGNLMPGKGRYENIDPFPKLYGATVHVWVWISILIPHYIMDVIIYPYKHENFLDAPQISL